MDPKTTDKLLGGVLVALIAIAVVGGMVEAIRGENVNTEGLLAKGAVAPAFQAVRHADKKLVKSEELAGKVVVLDFWGTWCPHCVNEMPVLHDVARSYASRPDMVFLALDYEEDDADPTAKVSAFLKENGLTDYPVAYPAPDVMDRFQVRSFPTLYVIGKDGKVRFRMIGEVSGSRLRSEIDAALKG